MREIWQNARRHAARRRGRTALTVGGIAVGVLMVTLMSLLGVAGTEAVNGELQRMGLQGVSLSAVSADTQLGTEELELVRGVKGVTRAMPLTMTGGKGELGQYEFTAYIGGIDAGADQIISLETAHGRLLTAGDVAAWAPVCVVDEAVAIAAYGRVNVVGKTLWLTVGDTTRPLTVVGVAKAGSSLLQSVTGYLAGLVYLPYTTLRELGGGSRFDQIAVTVSEDTAVVRGRVLATLERASGVSGGFAAQDLAARREQLAGILDLVTAILTAVSAVSLLVAGIGMLTSMLTAVQERVREIGIKQSLGAGRGRILAEFLAEAVLLAGIGGVTGVAAGALIGAIGLRAMGLSIALPVSRFVLIVAATVLLGALCGWYPAHKAASLHPVEALRAEIG